MARVEDAAGVEDVVGYEISRVKFNETAKL